MSDAFLGPDHDDEFGGDVDVPTDAEQVRTGDAAVDAVLDELVALDGSPVDDHVAVFERAHEQLRRALDTAP